MDYLLGLTVWDLTLVAIAAIALDSVIGIIKAIVSREFDFRKLPRFIASDVFPYIGGMVVLAFTVEMIGEPFTNVFYLIAPAVAIKYLAEIKDKYKALYELKKKAE